MTTTPDTRTGLETLSTDECWRLLGEHEVGRLAVSINHHPDIFPVNYRVQDETILVHTAAGLKLAAATLGPAVAFEVEEGGAAAHDLGEQIAFAVPGDVLERRSRRLCDVLEPCRTGLRRGFFVRRRGDAGCEDEEESEEGWTSWAVAPPSRGPVGEGHPLSSAIRAFAACTTGCFAASSPSSARVRSAGENSLST